MIIVLCCQYQHLYKAGESPIKNLSERTELETMKLERGTKCLHLFSKYSLLILFLGSIKSLRINNVCLFFERSFYKVTCSTLSLTVIEQEGDHSCI